MSSTPVDVENSDIFGAINYFDIKSARNECVCLYLSNTTNSEKTNVSIFYEKDDKNVVDFKFWFSNVNADGTGVETLTNRYDKPKYAVTPLNKEGSFKYNYCDVVITKIPTTIGYAFTILDVGTEAVGVDDISSMKKFNAWLVNQINMTSVLYIAETLTDDSIRFKLKDNAYVSNVFTHNASSNQFAVTYKISNQFQNGFDRKISVMQSLPVGKSIAIFIQRIVNKDKIMSSMTEAANVKTIDNIKITFE